MLESINHQQKNVAFNQQHADSVIDDKMSKKGLTYADIFKHQMSSIARTGAQYGLNALGDLAKSYNMDTICLNVDNDKIPQLPKK